MKKSKKEIDIAIAEILNRLSENHVSTLECIMDDIGEDLWDELNEFIKLTFLSDRVDCALGILEDYLNLYGNKESISVSKSTILELISYLK